MKAQSRKEKNRLAILNSAAALLAKDPRVSLADIAKNAGVGRATLHRHFPGRDDLIKALTLLCLEETTNATEHLWHCTSSKEALRELFVALVPLGDKYHFLSYEPAAYGNSDIKREYDRQLEETRALVKSLRGEGLVADSVPDSWATSLIDNMIYTCWSEVNAGHVTSEQAATLAFNSLIAAFAEPAHIK